VPQLVKRFGKSYTVESVELGKKYKFRSANVSVDAIVANGVSICETYLSDHPLTASGEPPNDIVRGVLRTNASKTRWVETEAAPFGADYALRSSDGKYIAILSYNGAQPENSVWTMTVGSADSVHALSSTTSPSAIPSPPTWTAAARSGATSPSDSAAPTPHISSSPSPVPRFEEIRAKAEAGDAASQYELGVRYYNGNGVAKDFAEAAKWYRKAADQRLAVAQGSLAACYFLGEGVSEDYAEAVTWLRKAAEQNDPGAQHLLGFHYANGVGVQKDPIEAVKWFRKAAEQNVPQGQYDLGLCYARGEGVRKGYAEAVKWFRKAAEQNVPDAQNQLGLAYVNGQGVPKDPIEAVKWFREAAKQNHPVAQYCLGLCYDRGQGVPKNHAEAVKWWRKAAEQNHVNAQHNLALAYAKGEGVPKNYAEAVKWWRKAAEQNHVNAQHNLALAYTKGEGVPKNYVEAYKWLLLASAEGDENSKKLTAILESLMSREQIAEGQKLARDFKPREGSSTQADRSGPAAAQMHPMYSGTGFFITEDGYVITNEHVAGSGTPVRLVTASGLIGAKLVKVDATNDLALLKAEGKFEALPVVTSRSVKLGTTAVTVGFPNVGLQGFAPKFARGEIASLAGPMDDPRFFQISVPLQPGNSGGALVDERGNVIGVVSAKLSASATLKATGELPENVNYAVKSSFLLGFLESVPEVAAKLKAPNTSDIQLAEVVERAKKAAVLLLVGDADRQGEQAAIDSRR
jgi:TPR repeat protein